MLSNVKKKAGLAAVGVIALSVVAIGPAHADYQPSGTDVVGLGGDTPQFAFDFILDGDTAGDSGYNAANNVNKAVYFNATADSNGRAAYDDGSTLAAPKPLNATNVLRAGTTPVQRNQSSGSAITALLADNGPIHKIDYIASASLPTAAQQGTANDVNHKWGSLHVVKFGGDTIKIVGSTNTHAPANLSVTDLLNIYTGVYTKWNQIPGNSAGSANTIIPLLPPSGSTINKNFIADLKTANGGTAATLAGVTTVEQNDPNAITGASSPADAIVPFSSARLALYNANYFHDPSTVFPGGAVITAGVSPIAGYSNSASLYIIFRESDVSAAPWQPGSSLNWSQVLFSNPATAQNPTPSTPWIAKSSTQALITAAGSTATYQDLGAASSG